MAHGKETPRQKMIGMMYLVLTALLALNVSKEVLDAFVLVDEGLTKTTENFNAKNELIYDEFNVAFASNESKVGPWKEKAENVRSRADSLYNFIQELKLDIIRTSEGDDTEVISEGVIHGELIGGKDNTDVPAQIMIGGDGKGKAIDLKESIKVFREYLISITREQDTSIRASINKNLDTRDKKQADGQKVSWEIQNFQSLPLIAVITLMSKMQTDVRNAQAEILGYLFRQIDRGAVKFNKTEATIIPNTNYVIQGNEYEAKIFLAARDTTQDPEVLIGNYKEINREDGTIGYEMVGDYETVDVIEGKGIFKRKGVGTGSKKWGGIIRIKTPDGFIEKPFQQEYQVALPSFVVSPTKMNVFYVGVDNPVAVSVAGIPANKIFPSITNGVMIRERNAGKYIVKPRRPGNSIVTIVVEIDGNKRKMGSTEFRVKRVPDPVAKVAGKKGGPIKKNILLAQNGVIADMENFDFNLKFKVTSFTVSANNKGFFVEEASKSNRFTDKQINLMKGIGRNSKVYIEDIKAVGPDGTVRALPTISFKII